MAQARQAPPIPLTVRAAAGTFDLATALRWARLGAGLLVFAGGLALMIRADLGLSSWDVLHDAVRRLTPLTFGQAVVAISVLVVAVSFALGVRPGPGTAANMILIGVMTDGLLATGALTSLSSGHPVARGLALVVGIGAIALGTALYIGARLGAGPRDSLMLAASRALGVSPGAARAAIEGTVLVVGALLGGTLGLGTVAFAVLIGPAINVSFRALGLGSPSTQPVHRSWRDGVHEWLRRGQLGSASSIRSPR